MSMVTKCPACNTLFRVTSQQLQARQGQVRCGKCMAVFDGLGQMSPVQTPAEPAIPPAAIPVENPDRRAETAQAGRLEDPPKSVSPQPIPEFVMEPRTVPDAVATEPPAAVPETLSARAGEAASAYEDEVDLVNEMAALPRRTRWWTVGSALLLITLIGQAAYFYRTELAANYPALKPAMAQICQTLGCTVPLPQRPRLISVEASDLQAVDPARPNVIQLTATLRSHAKFDLGYPALDLVLTNSKDHTLARRIFMPREYLESSRNVRAGLAANAEITIRLSLDTGSLGAAGFRLDLLPGPAY